MSAHSNQKWQSLGTRESVKETRNKYLQFKNNRESAEAEQALKHALKVSREGSCKWPRARIVSVRDVYPSTSITYIPHCVILHRCSDDTGCCTSKELTCVPKHFHRVELYFYASSFSNSVTDDSEIINELKTTVGSIIKDLSLYQNKFQSDVRVYLKQVQNDSVSKTSGSVRYVSNSIKTSGVEGGGSVVKKLNFDNHTECECRERSEFNNKTENPSDARVTRQHPLHTSPQNIPRPPEKKLCRCPSKFTLSINPHGECQCKCVANDKSCIQERRGKAYFSSKDRLCIQNGGCSRPLCEFGDYMMRQGKCPRKQEQYDVFSNYHRDINPGFRS